MDASDCIGYMRLQINMSQCGQRLCSLEPKLLNCFVLLLFVQPPFTGNRQKIQQKIVKEKIKLPAFLSSEAHSLLKAVKLHTPSMFSM
jgi:hypothetical protein